MTVEPSAPSHVASRLEAVKYRIEAAAHRSGRDPAAVSILGVTKTFGPEAIALGLDAGLRIVGENRVQEAQEKIPMLRALGYSAEWHLVGHLQTNKVRPALDLFQRIQSVDSLRLANAINRVAAEQDRPVQALIEVNTSGEPAKHGFMLSSVANEVKAVLQLQHLEVRGLMTMGPMTADKSEIRSAFRSLRELRDHLTDRFPLVTWDTLSMGMSDDFELAVEEGSTMVRLGRTIFGSRSRTLVL